MPNRLADAVSPYLKSHADNPVDWFEWGSDAFAEAARRDVPVLVSIGYSTCHWCHVMARESFSDPGIAAVLNDGFVAIKVDREEHPDVDAAYLAAAQAFTPHLGWPLNVFVTPAGRAFFAGTYFPPAPVADHPAFRTVLDAVADAWRDHREEVESNAAAIVAALQAPVTTSADELPTDEELGRVVAELEGYEDARHGGFGGAPKFPVAPVLLMLQQMRRAPATALATRTLDAMAASDLRDPVEGGVFRYATRADWTEPHYERMLYDNAQLLDAYSASPGGAAVAVGIAGFLRDVMRLPGGGFASAQDSESTVDGQRVEGGYYALDAGARARQHPPALDEKVLTGWNGLAIDALATAGARLDRPDWVELARAAADALLDTHRRPDGALVRASIGSRTSQAVATLEDYGMFAAGLLAVALATGESSYAVEARRLVDATLADGVFAAPAGGDPVLVAQGLALEADPSEGAYPSGVSAISGAAHTLFLLTGERRYLDAATLAMRAVAPLALPRPISFGASLRVMARLRSPVVQLVVVGKDVPIRSALDPRANVARATANREFAGAAPADASGMLVDAARNAGAAASVVAVVTEQQAASFADAGFELFAGRTLRDGRPAAYLCRDFVCRLPITDAADLRSALLT